ncbi:hypothetical protein ACFS07_34160 [Undibacterium arcticum]
MAFGAIEAFEAAGHKQTKIVGIGGVPESVEAIKAGRLLATSEFNGYKMGCIATMAAVRTVRKQAVPPNIIIKGVVIDKKQYHFIRIASRQASVPEVGRDRQLNRPSSFQSSAILTTNCLEESSGGAKSSLFGA